MWGVFKSVWPRKNGSAKCLSRTTFSPLSGRSIEAESEGKRRSENTRTAELKEPESRRNEKVNERERPRTKNSRKRELSLCNCQGAPSTSSTSRLSQSSLIGSRWRLPHWVQLGVVLISQKSHAQLPQNSNQSLFWCCVFTFHGLMYWQIVMFFHWV